MRATKTEIYTQVECIPIYSVETEYIILICSNLKMDIKDLKKWSAIPYHRSFKCYKIQRKNFFPKGLTNFCKIIPHISGRIMAFLVDKAEKIAYYML
jgi:hypothetical protein